MNTKLHDQIRANMQRKNTEDLIEIWKLNDKEEYSDQTFQVIREILEERGCEIPPQETRIEEKVVPVELPRSKPSLYIGVAFILLGFLIYAPQLISTKTNLIDSITILCLLPLPFLIGGILLVKRSSSPPVTFWRGLLTLLGGLLLGKALGSIGLFIVAVALLKSEPKVHMETFSVSLILSMFLLFFGFRSTKRRPINL
ncbi:MAG: hypothetical protein K9K37_11515 [Desulfocapsa sp.]|nr:hypothetical protein [Desulfocapsa sp.]